MSDDWEKATCLQMQPADALQDAIEKAKAIIADTDAKIVICFQNFLKRRYQIRVTKDTDAQHILRLLDSGAGPIIGP